MWCRGIRGATTVENNHTEEILAATRELLQKIVEANDIRTEEVAMAYFTTTTDLDAEFPAVAARQLGWNQVPLLCGHEMQVQGSLPKCIRVLVLVNTERRQNEMVHIYIRGAENLRTPPPPLIPS